MPLNNFNNLISWSDFIQTPARPLNVNEDAEIHLRFPQRYEYAIGRHGATITNLNIDIEIASPECWVLSSQATNIYLLKHEQGHYDITALGAREFYDALTGLSAANENALNAKIRRVRDNIQQKINRANYRYDTETSHSQNTGIQQTWSHRIDDLKRNVRGRIDDLP